MKKKKKEMGDRSDQSEYLSPQRPVLRFRRPTTMPFGVELVFFFVTCVVNFLFFSEVPREGDVFAEEPVPFLLLSELTCTPLSLLLLSLLLRRLARFGELGQACVCCGDTGLETEAEYICG